MLERRLIWQTLRGLGFEFDSRGNKWCRKWGTTLVELKYCKKLGVWDLDINHENYSVSKWETSITMGYELVSQLMLYGESKGERSKVSEFRQVLELPPAEE